MGSDTEMTAAPIEPGERKHKESTRKSSKHRSRDKDRSQKGERTSPSAPDKEVSESKHKRKHRSGESRHNRSANGEGSRSKAPGNGRERSPRERSPRRKEHRRSPQPIVSAEPGELAADPKHGRDAAAEAEDILRLAAKDSEADVARPSQSLPPPPVSHVSGDASTNPDGLPPLAGDVPAGHDSQRDHQPPQVKDSGGEVSMSVDETNKCAGLLLYVAFCLALFPFKPLANLPQLSSYRKRIFETSAALNHSQRWRVCESCCNR